MDKHTVQFDARGHCVKDKHLISVANIIIVFKSNLDYFLFMKCPRVANLKVSSSIQQLISTIGTNMPLILLGLFVSFLARTKKVKDRETEPSLFACKKLTWTLESE